jgi:hypothetical protein
MIEFACSDLGCSCNKGFISQMECMTCNTYVEVTTDCEGE